MAWQTPAPYRLGLTTRRDVAGSEHGDGMKSAGILLYRERTVLEVLIGHPGGPFWVNKHEGAWSIIKGLVEPDEVEVEAALREFREETGHPLRSGAMIALGEVRLRSGKVIVAWAIAGDIDPDSLSSNEVEMEWPRNSGRMVSFPEIDKFRWSTIPEAASLLNPNQIPFLHRLEESLDHQQ